MVTSSNIENIQESPRTYIEKLELLQFKNRQTGCNWIDAVLNLQGENLVLQILRLSSAFAEIIL